MANILWAGTEEDAFDATTGTLGTDNTATNYDSNFSRIAIDAFGATRCNKVGFGNIPEGWFHTRWGGSNVGSTQNARSIIEFRNSSGQGVLRLFSQSTPSFLFQYWNGSTWVTIGSAIVVTFANGRTWDIRCKIDNTTGDFSCYVDGVIQAQLTGDTDQFSGSAVDYVIVQSWGATNARYQSELIIADYSTLAMRLATLVPNGNGANTAWTGTFADVDESAINDADFLSSPTANQVETMTLTDLSATAGALTPVAVINSARARNGAAGPQNLQLAARTGGTDFFSASVSGLNTSFTSGYQKVWMTNPNTVAPWTVSDINGLEIGDKSIT